jgi:pantoate kinase
MLLVPRKTAASQHRLRRVNRAVDRFMDQACAEVLNDVIDQERVDVTTEIAPPPGSGYSYSGGKPPASQVVAVAVVDCIAHGCHATGTIEQGEADDPVRSPPKVVSTLRRQI